MVDFGAAVRSAEELDKAVGIVASLIGKLKAKPDLAAQKLVQALQEVAKTLQVVDSAISEFLSLGIDAGALEQNSKLLLDIEGGSLSSEVQRGRGHCHTIWQIYSKYLDKWFESAFKSDEYESVKDVFRKLGDADNNLFYNLERVTIQLEEEAGIVLDLVLKAEQNDARQRVLSTLPNLRPLRRTMARTMQALYSMQSDFIEITRAV